MNEMISFLIKYKDSILIDIIGGLILAFLLGMVSIIKKWLSPKPIQKTKGQAIYLNSPKCFFDDNCRGRDEHLDAVFNVIKDGRKNLFKRKCIAITGEEGIGKSLFCYTLFQDYLEKESVYLGWIDCNGKQSIFDIIKTTFKDSQFHRKNKEDILNAFKNMDNPCILFADQVDQYTPIDELKELVHRSNVILIIAGLLKEIKFADFTFKIEPLPKEIIEKLFEEYSDEDIYLMKGENRKSVRLLLDRYVKGNPFLAIAFAKAKCHYSGRWSDMLQNMERREYIDEDYLKSILKQLYKINELNNSERIALSQLSTIKYKGFVKAVFNFFNISEHCIKRLCNTYWLVQEDRVLYYMDEFHNNAIIKVLADEVKLKSAINAIYVSLLKWGAHKDNGFKWISLYAEDILKRVQGYAPHIMDEELFGRFAYEVAAKYEIINDRDQQLKWIELCKPQDIKLAFKKTCLELRAKSAFMDTLFDFSEINQGYLDVLEKTKTIDEYKKEERYLIEEYCFFLIGSKRYDEAISLCKKYFEVYDMDLSNGYNCDMFLRYLQVACLLEDEETLRNIISEQIIADLYENENVSISVAWSFGKLGKVYEEWGDKDSSERYMKHMVILLNEKRCFFHDDIKDSGLEISDMEFAEYMHSCNELLESLNDALNREDAEALYIEGRYQEKQGNYDDAYELYESAATRDSLRGMCSLAVLYYRGLGVTRDYDRARRYWEYCCERGHRGSYYWLSILLLDTAYSRLGQDYNKDKELALQYLTKAAELGSERAKQKILEL